MSAFGINLLVIPFSSSVGAISQRRNIDKEIALYMIIGGSSGSIMGALIAGLIPRLVLAMIFVTVSVITILGIYLDRVAPKFAQKINPKPWVIVAGALFLNLITGLRGGSGGSLFPPFLRAMKLNVHRAIATSLFITIFTAIVAVIIYWQRGNIIWLPAIFVLIGSMIGTRIGSKISLKTKPLWLEIGLSVLVLVLALLIIYKAL